MRRPLRFAEELKRLPTTYQWALRQDVAPLASAVRAWWAYPMVAVGSGGSLSAAHFAARLHQRATGNPAQWRTPLEAVDLDLALRDKVLVVFSAKGRNRDVVGALRALVAREPGCGAVITASETSPLVTLARHSPPFQTFGYAPPHEDGYLATHSMLSSCVLFYRAYVEAGLPEPEVLPGTFHRLLVRQGRLERAVAQVKSAANVLWKRDVLVVLHGTATATAALDLESKLTEAGARVVVTADFRNFAHGRHFWLHRQAARTAVLAISSLGDRELAARTLQALPSAVPTAVLEVDHSGPVADLAACSWVFHLTGFAAEAAGVNAARPGVPAWGRSLYHLRAFDSPRVRRTNSASVDQAVARKTSVVASIAQLVQPEDWRVAAEAFLQRLRAAEIGAVLLDYDGTLCPSAHRFTGIGGTTVAAEVERVLKGGLRVGIATGRGRSVGEDLRSWVPRCYWGQVMIGYYNGAEISTLEATDQPCTAAPADPALEAARDALERPGWARKLADMTWRPRQATLEVRHGAHVVPLFEHVVQLLAPLALRLTVVRTSRSVDVLAPGVSKLNLLEALQSTLPTGSPAVLCIGDQGRWPGNDSELLASPLSLSVDTVSPDPATCWNLAPPGVRGVDATEWYLKRIRVRRGGARFELGKMGGS